MRSKILIGFVVCLGMCAMLFYINLVPLSFRWKESFEIQERLQTLHGEKDELLRVITEIRNNRTAELCPKNVSVQPLQQETVQLAQKRSNISRNELAQKPESSSNPLTYEMEHARRKAENTVTELWYFIDSVLKKSGTEKGQTPLNLSELRENLQGYKRTIFGDFEKLRTANGADVYRQKRLQELGDLIQRRLEYLQNPTDCDTAKKLVCILTTPFGFGCQLHHLVHCLISAYALERTLVLKIGASSYSTKSFETELEPMSRTCLDTQLKKNTTHWPAAMKYTSGDNTIYLTSSENYSPTRPAFLPPAVPADLAHELSILHGNPSAWWIGQMVRYIFRLKPNLLEEVISRGKKAGFSNTIVGVHIRRTDKLAEEAAAYSVDEYMYHVKEYYDQMERTQPGITRRVYLATDEPTVLSEARKKYPTYTFINDFNGTRSATMASRNSRESMHGIISDVYYLARCDYLVCTFSSNVCRLVYELMQTLRGDASRNVRSLDAVYFFHGQNRHDLTAIEAYRSNKKGHIELMPGDVITAVSNHWNGFSKGTNQRTRQTGLFPSDKAEDTVVAAVMPTYPQVPFKLPDKMGLTSTCSVVAIFNMFSQILFIVLFLML